MATSGTSGTSTAANGAPALQTSRPWLSVAGCLGGGVVSIALFLIALLAFVIWFFFPEWLPFGNSGS